MTRGVARKGDRIECPSCGRWIGYWPDKSNPYRAHLMPHNDREHDVYSSRQPLPCECSEVNG